MGHVINKSNLVMGEDGQEYIQAYLFDVTAQKARERSLESKVRRYETVLAKTGSILFVLDMETKKIEFSKNFGQVFGYEPSSLEFDNLLDGKTHVHPDDILLIHNRLNAIKQGSDFESPEIRIATENGYYTWFKLSAGAERDESGKLLSIIGSIRSINTEKRAMLALKDMVDRDVLTGLIHKEAAKRQVDEYLAGSNGRRKCAMLLVDIDELKIINDKYGRSLGDRVICRVAQCLETLFSSQDIVARVGGDKFMVLVEGTDDRHLLSSQCRRIRDMLLQSHSPDAPGLELSCSIGLAICPEKGGSFQSLYSNAGSALHKAEAAGRNGFCFYSE